MDSRWTIAELSLSGVKVLDCEHRTPPGVDAGFPYVAIPNIRDGRLDLTSVRRITADDYREWTRRTVPQPGDIIVTRRGRVGDTAVVPPDLQCAIGQNLVILRSASQVFDQSYLRWVTRGPLWEAEVRRLTNVGAVFDSLNVRDIARIRVPVPPVTDQVAIAKFLCALDDKIAVNERIADTAYALAEALYVRDSAAEQGWRKIALADTAKWLSGGTPKTSEPSYWDGDIPWISAASLKTPWLDDSERKITPLGAENGTRLVPAGTIIFVVRGMSLTSEFRIGLTQREVAFGQDCKALIPHGGIDPVVLLLALRARTREILALVDTAGHGTGRLGTDRIAKLRVRLPAGDKATAFSETVRPLTQRASAVQRENRTLAALRDTLLPQLITGKIRVKDAERVVEDATS